MEYWIAFRASSAGRKSLTATSLFSFFLSLFTSKSSRRNRPINQILHYKISSYIIFRHSKVPNSWACRHDPPHPSLRFIIIYKEFLKSHVFISMPFFIASAQIHFNLSLRLKTIMNKNIYWFIRLCSLAFGLESIYYSWKPHRSTSASS